MENQVFYAATDFEVVTEDGSLLYQKGDMVELATDEEEEDVYIVSSTNKEAKKEEEDGKDKTAPEDDSEDDDEDDGDDDDDKSEPDDESEKEEKSCKSKKKEEVIYKVASKKIFEGLMKNAIVHEDEMEIDTSFQDANIREMLLKRECTVPALLDFITSLTENQQEIVEFAPITEDVDAEYVTTFAEVMAKKVIRGGEVVKVPVKRRKKKLTAKQRAARIKAGRQISKSLSRPDAKRKRAKSLKLRKSRHLDSVGYFIDYNAIKEGLIEESESYSLGMAIRDRLNNRIGDKVSTYMLNDGRVKVELLSGSSKSITSVLDEMDCRYEIDDNAYDAENVYVIIPKGGNVTQEPSTQPIATGYSMM